MARRHFVRSAAAVSSVVILLAATWWLWDHRHYWIKNNFRVIEPGKIYAGGYQYPIPLARLLSEHRIKTVVCLRGDEDAHQEKERELLSASGVEFRQVTIPFGVPNAEKLAAVQQAVAVISDPQNQPVFVHCFAGCHRTGAVIAVYRVYHCGWSEAAAREELRQWGGFSRNSFWPDKVLRAYCTQAVTDQPSEPDRAGSRAELPL